ncbi:MAG TPA: TIGR01841 family phasin [Vineibacter sp.]|nr:TIGR01841 family phasin [Vineibacter sp.]
MSSLQTPWVDFKVPSLNVEALLDTHRKNAAALTSANQVAFDGFKAVAQRQGDMIKTTVDDYAKAAGDVLAAASFEERAAKQADAAWHIYTSAVTHLRALSDLALQANVAAADILNARVTEAFDEFKALFAAPVTATAEPVAVVAPTTVVEATPVTVEPVTIEPVAVEPVVVVEAEPTPEDTPPAPAPKPAPRTRRAPPRR